MLFNLIFCTSYILKDFLETTPDNNWVKSSWKTDTNEDGDFVFTSVDIDTQKYNFLKTSNDSKFHTISRKFEPFSNKGRNVSFYYVVANKQDILCGGSYIKLFPSVVDIHTLKGGENEDKYNIMFGPDVCGSQKNIHLIFNHNGINMQRREKIPYSVNKDFAMYGLTLFSDDSYSVTVDNKEVSKGFIKNDYPVPSEYIEDVTDKKPSDWIDSKMMDDPSDYIPDGWNDIPPEIQDPSATVPEDWNEEDDGTWEAPTVPNPEYKGEWKPKSIENPNYKGEWLPRQIKNEEYKMDEVFGSYEDFGVLGIELWQVQSGTHFGMFLVTDDEKELESYKYEVLNFIKEEQKITKKQKEDDEKLKKSEEEEKELKKSEEESSEEEEEEEEEAKDEL